MSFLGILWLKPIWLWSIPVWILLYLGFRYLLARREKRFEGFAAKEVWKQIAPELDWKARPRKFTFLFLAFVLLSLTLARPQYGTREKTITLAGLDVIILFDVSNSMLVEDVVPSRLEKAKHFARALVQRLGGDRVGVVAFAGSAFPASPLTYDADYVTSIIDTLDPKMIKTQGTNLAAALQTAVNALDRGAIETAESQAITGAPPSRVIVLISDGEDLEGGVAEVVGSLKEQGIRLSALGVGTQSGGKIPVRDPHGMLRGYHRDSTGREVVSQFKPNSLLALVEEVNGSYWTLTPDEVELEDLLRELGVLERADYQEKRIRVKEERFQIPLVLALLLLLWELFLPARRISAGSAALLTTLVFSFLFGIAPARADREPPLDAYLDNEEALEAYEDGNYEKAEEKFGDAQARDPRRPSLLYNQGVVQKETGRVDDSVLSFEGAAREARKRGQKNLEGRSLYNLGGALEAKGDFGAAAEAFLGALDSARKAENPEFEKQIQNRLARLAVKRQKQKQKSQGKDQNPDPQQKDDQKKGDQSQTADSGKEKKRYNTQSSRNREFKSKKLSKEDVERLMKDLMNREKEVRQKLQKKKQARTRSKGKTW